MLTRDTPSKLAIHTNVADYNAKRLYFDEETVLGFIKEVDAINAHLSA